MKNNLTELRKTLEKIRSEQYPDIPEDVINEIIDIQYKYQDNPSKRQNETQKIIIKYANQIPADGGNENEI